MTKSNKIIEYSIYSLLSFFLAVGVWWVLGGFIAQDFNILEYHWLARAMIINLSCPAPAAVWVKYAND